MRIRTRLAELERSNGVVDIGDNQLLVTLLARRDALFWPWRNGGDSRLGIIQRQRQYLDGSVGIASKSDGKSSWKPMHEARQRLISAGFVDALHSSGQVSSMFITPLGEAYARRIIGDRLKAINDVAIIYVMLDTDKWTSESELFRENLLGNPEDWSDSTELVLPLLVSGLVTASSDMHGRVGYRKTDRELPPDPPEIDVECDESMDSIYVNAFNSERSSLQQCEPLDINEVWIPLLVSSLANYEETK